MSDISALVPLITNLGLPIVALYYLFRAYEERVKKGDQREDRYSEVLESHSSQCSKLADSIKGLTEEIRAEAMIRQELLAKFVDKALRDDKPGK